MYVENMVYIASIKRKERTRSRRSYIDTGMLIGLVIIFKSQLTSLVQIIFQKITSESSGI